MTYAEAIQFLYDLQLFGLKLGLENTRRLAELAGQPHERLRFIHVAGTNGKGSTCAMLESIYRAAGLRVGLFTSPHLVSFGERIQVNRQPLSEPEVVRLVTAVRELMGAFPEDHSPTFFEVVAVMALQYFVEERCDLVIWETGLGGRLDATNIVTPLASVITNIALDHQRWLGETESQIAVEKAGIIKPGVPLITGTNHPAAFAVLAQAAERCEAKVHQVLPAEADLPPLDHLELPLLGRHQRFNAAVAVATVRTLQPLLPVPDEAVVRGLQTVSWLGRCQLVRSASGQLNLLDGAHNPAGMQSLTATLAQHFPGQHPTLIIGILRDKDWLAMCDAILPFAHSVCLVPVASARTATPEELRAVCATRHPKLTLNLCHSLAEALRLTHAEPFRLIAGSLYLVGEALELLGAFPPANRERGLNDWTVTAGNGVVPSLGGLHFTVPRQ